VVLAGPGIGQEKPARSPFAGNYSGPFTTKGLKPGYHDDRGSYAISVAANGKVTGSSKSDVNGVRTELAGSVNAAGRMEFTCKYGPIVFMMKGTVTKTTAGRLKGTLLQYSSSGKEVVARDEIELRPR
jgi:hypothetical protein